MRDSPHSATGLVPFAWFWTFWHWSSESFRVGASLHSPLHGIGGLWDEWFQHEATDAERRAIDVVGADSRAQRRFVAWIVRRWGTEAQWLGHRPSARFVLGQIAHFPPFDRWATMERYRSRYGVAGGAAAGR